MGRAHQVGIRVVNQERHAQLVASLAFQVAYLVYVGVNYALDRGVADAIFFKALLALRKGPFPAVSKATRDHVDLMASIVQVVSQLSEGGAGEHAVEVEAVFGHSWSNPTTLQRFG